MKSEPSSLPFKLLPTDSGNSFRYERACVVVKFGRELIDPPCAEKMFHSLVHRCARLAFRLDVFFKNAATEVSFFYRFPTIRAFRGA